MNFTARVALALAAVCASGLALAAASGPPDTFWGGMAATLGEAVDRDAASPVKVPVVDYKNRKESLVTDGVKHFQGSVTALRCALSNGVVRLAGMDIVPAPTGPVEPWKYSNAFAFPTAENQANLETAFKKAFGKALVKSRAGDGPEALVAYDPAAIQAAFDRVYPKPSALLGGVPAQKVYDLLFKDWVEGRAEVLADALGRPGLLADRAQEYRTATAAAGFNGPGFAYDLARKLEGPLKHEERFLGMLLRRQLDGTLPTIVGCLRRVLRDYDPATFRRLDPGLTAPRAGR
jgi:hypothetical protein